ncbi:hypothetical protein AN219_08605, partial [Streptomyces nanshensis]
MSLDSVSSCPRGPSSAGPEAVAQLGRAWVHWSGRANCEVSLGPPGSGRWNSPVSEGDGGRWNSPVSEGDWGRWNSPVSE